MPVQKCTNDGKSGFKWGKAGKCFTGPGARNKAAKQGQAIKSQESKTGAHTSRMDVLLASIADTLENSSK